jgi:hypothetical protein
VFREGSEHITQFLFIKRGEGVITTSFLCPIPALTPPPPKIRSRNHFTLSKHNRWGQYCEARKMYTLNNNMYSPVARCESFNRAGTIHLVSLTIEFYTRYSLLVDTQYHKNKFDFAFSFESAMPFLVYFITQIKKL